MATILKTFPTSKRNSPIPETTPRLRNFFARFQQGFGIFFTVTRARPCLGLAIMRKLSRVRSTTRLSERLGPRSFTRQTMDLPFLMFVIFTYVPNG